MNPTLLVSFIFIYWAVVLRYIECFSITDHIKITKITDEQSIHHCLIETQLEIIDVTCDNCTWTKLNNVYELQTVRLEKITFNVNYNKQIIKLPFIVNCNNDALDVSNNKMFKLSMYKNYILIKFETVIINGFLLFYTDRKAYFSKIIGQSLTNYKLEKLEENSTYFICIAPINDDGEARKYKCASTETNSTGNGFCKNESILSYFKVRFVDIDQLRIKWSLNTHLNCRVKEFHIKLSKTRYSLCLQQIRIRDVRLSGKVKNEKFQDCSQIRTLEHKQLKYGKIFQRWHMFSVYWQLFIVTLNGNIHRIKKPVTLSRKQRAVTTHPPNTKEIVLKRLGSTSLNANWKNSEHLSRTNPKSFNLKLKKNQKVIKTVKVSSVEYTFKTLTPCTIYCLDVHGVKKKGISKRKVSACSSTGVPEAFSLDMEPSITKTGRVEVKIPNYDSTACKIKYSIAASIKGAKDICTKKFNTKFLPFNLIGLKRNVPYQLAVRATVNKHLYIDSKKAPFFHGKKIARPDFTLVEAKFIKSNQITMEWTLKKIKKKSFLKGRTIDKIIMAILIKISKQEKSRCLQLLHIQVKSSKDCKPRYIIPKDDCGGKINKFDLKTLTKGKVDVRWAETSFYPEVIVVTINEKLHKGYASKLVSLKTNERNEKPATGNKKPATGNKKPATGNKKPATGNKKPATGNKKPATGNKNPATGNKKPATGNKNPATGNKKPATGNKKPATGNKKPATGNKKPATESENCFVDCYSQGVYNGFRLTDASGNKCDKGRCKIISGSPKCYVRRVLKDCSVPKCESLKGSTGKCLQLTATNSSSTNIGGTWKPSEHAIGYVVLVKDQNGKCLGCNTLKKPKVNSYGLTIQNLYKFCVQPCTIFNLSNGRYVFSGLQPGTQYTVFIITVLNSNSIGVIKVVKVETTGGTKIGLIIGLVVALLVIVIIILTNIIYKKNYGSITNIRNDSELGVKKASAIVGQNILIGTEPATSMRSVGRILSKVKKPSLRRLPPTIDIKDFNKYVVDKSKNSYAAFVAEFNNLNKQSDALLKELGLTLNDGKRVGNLLKNSTFNVTYDQTRVELSDKVGPKNFISANKIPSSKTNHNLVYIASQGPMRDTLEDFVQMIWEQGIKTIIMIAKYGEKSQDKFVCYFPSEVSEKMLFSRNMRMKLQSIKIGECFTERNLMLMNEKTKSVRSVLHLHMESWSEFKTPYMECLDALFARLHKDPAKNAIFPYLVHCSHGIGRTGAFIVLDKITRALELGSAKINVYESVLELRKYRGLMVDKAEQYVFIYRYLDHFLEVMTTENKTEEETHGQ